jgi:hypothetical protein
MDWDDVDRRAARAAKALAVEFQPERPSVQTVVVSMYHQDERRGGHTARRVVAVAAAIVVAVGAVTFVVGRESGTTVTSAPPSTVPDRADANPSDVHVPIYQADGEPRAVAEAYLGARFPDYPTPEVQIDSVETHLADAMVRWSTHETIAVGHDPETIAQGSVILRRGPRQWAVVQATTDGVELHVGVSADGRLQGYAESSNINNLAVDVLDLQGTPVPGSAHPTGYPGTGNGSARYRFGTSGMSSGQRPGRAEQSKVDIDLPASTEPMLIRAQLVGGTMLSIAEIVIDTTPDGTVVGEGRWPGGRWKLVMAKSVRGAEGSPCGWIEVNGFRDKPACVVDDEPPALLRRAGSFEGQELYVAFYGPEVRKVRFEPEQGPVVEADTVADPRDPGGPRLAALTISGSEGFAPRLFDAQGDLVHPRPPRLHFPSTIGTLDAEVLVHRQAETTSIEVHLRSRPAGDPEWLMVIVDGRVEGATMPLIVDSTFGSRVDLQGAKQVQVVAATANGTVVASLAASADSLPVRN